MDTQASYTFNTVELDSQTFDDNEYVLKVLRRGWGLCPIFHGLFFLLPRLAHLLPESQVFSSSFLFTHPLRNPLSPFFYSEKVSCCPQILPHTAKQKSQWSESAATFCSSSTLFRDLSSFQHIWMNKSQHRYYLGPNWSEPFFHFIHLFNKYLLMFVPGAGDTTVSKIDLLMLRSLGGTWGDEWIQRFVRA